MRPALSSPISRPEIAALVGFPLAKLLFHLATFRGYGVFRDELYYRACSERLAWGYVDHPPLSVLLLRLAREVGGLFGAADGLFTLRLIPALAGAATLLLVGLTARRLGGGAVAQSLAMAAMFSAPIVLSMNHFYSMNALDVLFWAAAGYLLVGLLQDGPDASLGRWAGLGVVLGLGLLNKWSVLWLGGGLALGLVVTRSGRRLLATPGPWVTGAVSLLLFAPNLLWQAAHDWPTLEFMAGAREIKMVAISPWDFLGEQLLVMNPLTALVWVTGLLLFFLPHRREVRPLGVAFLAVFALLVLSGTARANYLTPAYAWLMAGGGVRWEELLRLVPRPAVARALAATAVVLLLATGAVVAPMAVPLLPVDEYVAYARRLGIEPSTEEKKELGRLPQFYADMQGWDEVARSFEAAATRLTPEERSRAVVFASNYGVAGALERFGRDLPPVVSGHNNYWLWGPGPMEPDVVLLNASDRASLETLFDSVERAGTVRCGDCMPYENDTPIWIARGPKASLRAMWPRLKNYS